MIDALSLTPDALEERQAVQPQSCRQIEYKPTVTAGGRGQKE
jgi:hypothetical protein